jgi:hypothetical protein
LPYFGAPWSLSTGTRPVCRATWSRPVSTSSSSRTTSRPGARDPEDRGRSRGCEASQLQVDRIHRLRNSGCGPSVPEPEPSRAFDSRRLLRPRPAYSWPLITADGASMPAEFGDIPIESSGTHKSSLIATRCPTCADCVEEVGELIVRDGSERQARAGCVMLRRASLQAAGSALPAFGGSGRWPPGGTRPEHQRGLSA